MDAELHDLRRRFPVSLRGMKLSHLIRVAERIGFSSRAVRLEMDHLDRLTLPCILHWDFDHYVVLTRVGRAKVTVLDPARGRCTLSWQEVSRRFTGIALELDPTCVPEPRRRRTSSMPLAKMAGEIRGLWASLARILLLSLALQVFVVLAPFYTQWVVDQVLVSADAELLTILGLGFAVSLMLQVAIGFIRGWSVTYLSATFGRLWTRNLFAHLLKLPLDFFERRNLGDITSRLSSVQAIQKTLTTTFVEAIIDGLMAAVTLGLMVAYSWRLAAVSAAAVSLYLMVRAAAYEWFRERSENQLLAAAKQQTYLLETLRGIQTLKVVGGEYLRGSRFNNLVNATSNEEVRISRATQAFTSASQLIFGLERVAVIWIGAVTTLRGGFSVGMLIAYLAYKDQFAVRVSSLIDKWVDFRMMRLHGERLSDIVLAKPEADVKLPEVSGFEEYRVEVRDLSFRYSEGEPWVLKGCNFQINAGESVAFVGPSGGGKTTLLKLLLGVLRPTEGSILVNGRDLHKLGARNVRAVVGAVLQEDQLFAGTIADNICFFDGQGDLGRIEAAARLAALHDDVMAMPMGYLSIVGDMGSALSGGQKQRLILARALYRKPLALFLDEATSDLDVARERLVNQAIRQLALTKIIVAHRPETIASADRVLIMDRGAVVEDDGRSRAGIVAPSSGAAHDFAQMV